MRVLTVCDQARLVVRTGGFHAGLTLGEIRELEDGDAWLRAVIRRGTATEADAARSLLFECFEHAPVRRAA